jgi:hypothetical protein
MEKLRAVIEQYGRWASLSIYMDRIETYKITDFGHALENAKAMLETIGKEICKIKSVEIEPTASISSVLRRAFIAIGYSSNDFETQISTSLANIGQKMGDLRNEIGPTSHGMNLDKLKERNDKIDIMTKEFLIDSTVIIACFLIRSFESRELNVSSAEVLLSEQEDFNNFWDDNYGEFSMGKYSYLASEILYYVDYPAYEIERKVYISGEGKNEE